MAVRAHWTMASLEAARSHRPFDPLIPDLIVMNLQPIIVHGPEACGNRITTA